MKDSWKSGDYYEAYMGRWSRLVADQFVSWLGVPPGLFWLDVGCGSGALSEAIAHCWSPASITSVDRSEGFVAKARDRLGNLADCRIGDATSLPLPDASVDVTVSGLVLNFIADPGKALSEMCRVTRIGGKLAVYVWDYAGEMEFLRYFWDMAVELKSEAKKLHESLRFPELQPDTLVDQFRNAGLTDIEAEPISIVTRFADFDDYWGPFLGGQGPAPTFVDSLDESEKTKLCELLRERLPMGPDREISLKARAWAVKGTR